MAVFQTNEPHADVHPRRTLAPGDVAFLVALQAALNTQSTMGNAQPVFWVIKGEDEVHVDVDPRDATHIIFEEETYDVSTRDGIYAFLTSDAVRERIEDHGLEYRVERLESGRPHASVESTVAGASGPIDDVDDLYDFLVDDANFSDSDVRTTKVAHEPHVYPNTFFLTHAACQEHLRNYGYNYDPAAHAYAMTATRSPEFERLLDVIRSVRWEGLAVRTDNEKGESAS